MSASFLGEETPAEDYEFANPNSPSSPDSTSGYYALLNVSRTATADEIRDKFKQLAVLLHPDKQQDKGHRELANEQFRRVQHAYQVLSDPARRAIYDEFGEAGLEYASQVGQKLKSSAEIIEEIERLAQNRTSKSRTSISRGSAVVAIDATTLDGIYEQSPYAADELIYVDAPIVERFKRIHVSAYNINHSLDIPFGTSDLFSISGGLRRGGKGSLLGTVKHQFSPRVVSQATFGLLDPHPLSVATTYTPDSLTQVKVVGHASPRRPFPPHFVVDVSRQLSPGLTGTVSYHTGWPLLPADPRTRPRAELQQWQASSIEVGLSGKNWLTELAIKGLTPTLSLQRKIQVSETTSLEIATVVNLLDSTGSAYALSVSATQNWRDLVSGGLSIGLGVMLSMEGVALRIRLARGGDSLVVPITLTDEPNLNFAICTTLLSTLALAGAELSILRSARNKLRRAERRRHEDALVERRRRAEAEIDVIRDAIIKRTEQEHQRQGLVILHASYGPAVPVSEYYPDGAASIAVDGGRTGPSSGVQADGSIDVTIAVQALVHNSQLNIPAGHSKAGLLGFYDPCYGRRKTLRVEYSFRGELHRASVEDTGGLVAPLRGHLVI